MKNDFEKAMSKRTDEELNRIISSSSGDYQPEAVNAAVQEIKKRQLIVDNLTKYSDDQILEILTCRNNYPEYEIQAAEVEAKKRNIGVYNEIEESETEMFEKKITLEFSYKKPSEEEAGLISETGADDRQIRKSKDYKDSMKSYRNHYRRLSMQYFFGSLVCAAIGVVCIIVMEMGVSGPLSFLNELSGTFVSMIVLFMSLGALVLLIIAIVIFVKSFASPSSSHPKSPESLLTMLFDDNIYFINERGSASKMETNMVKRDTVGNIRLSKLVPEKLRITQDQFREYCSAIDKTFKRAEKTIENAVKRECKSGHYLMGGSNRTKINIHRTIELYYNVYEVYATFANVYDCYDKKSRKYAIAVIEFNVKSVLIKNGEYWFPYDLTPELTIVS